MCPICLNVILNNEQAAKEHVKIPLEVKLPKGFIFKEKNASGKNLCYLIIKNSSILQGGDDENLGRRSNPHEYKYELLNSIPDSAIRGYFGYGRYTFSNDINCKFENREYVLLSGKEFRKFKIQYKKCINIENLKLKRNPAQLKKILRS